jgi:hypothetical protein
VANIALLIVVVVLAFYVVSVVRRRQHGLVARRGMSIGADLGALSDQPRVRIRAVTRTGPDRVHVVLSPEPGPVDGAKPRPPSDLDLDVSLREDEFGFELLHEWKRSERSIAIVIPPGSHIVRLRSIDDLQPLTLRRVDEDG